MSNPQEQKQTKPAEAEQAKAGVSEMIYEPRRVNMIAPKTLGREPANVKIKALQPIALKEDLILQPGEEAFVTETMANEFCRKIEGQYSFGGERRNEEATRHVHQRAERVAS